MEDNTNVLNSISEGTAAQDSVKMKSVSIADLIQKMQGLGGDAINKLGDAIEQIGKEADVLPAQANADANRATVQMTKEDLATIFGEDQKELSEDFLDKISTLFEAAVNLRVAIEKEAMFEEQAEIMEEEISRIEEEAEEAVAAIQEELTESLDAYLDATVNEWISENELAIESSVRLNQMESFFEGLYGLYEAHNISIPEEEADLVESLVQELEDIKAALNDALNENLEYQNILEQAETESIFDEVSEGLVATQKEKLRALVEGIDYVDTDDFRKKVSLIAEANFKKSVPAKPNNSLDEEYIPAETSKTSSRYVKALTQSVKK